jgi:hypothetical protein
MNMVEFMFKPETDKTGRTKLNLCYDKIENFLFKILDVNVTKYKMDREKKLKSVPQSNQKEQKYQF